MTNNLAALAGRIFLVLIFLDSGIEKFTQFSGTLGYMIKAGLPFPKALLILSGIVEIGCALAIIVGWRTRLAAIGLVIWMIPVTLIFHNPASGGEAMVHFMKNLAITGGLLVLFASGPGPWTLGRPR
jgi:putative oxidoreductase